MPEGTYFQVRIKSRRKIYGHQMVATALRHLHKAIFKAGMTERVEIPLTHPCTEEANPSQKPLRKTSPQVPLARLSHRPTPEQQRRQGKPVYAFSASVMRNRLSQQGRKGRKNGQLFIRQQTGSAR